MSRLILLNGPPGVGKSTLATRYAAEHPGTLCLDIDLLRTMVGGWEADYGGAGALIRPAALALTTGYLRESGDVILPQLLARESQLELFVLAGRSAGAEVTEVLLTADTETCVRRFEARETTTPHLRAALASVDLAGRTETLLAYHRALTDLAGRRPWTRVVDVGSDDADESYGRVLAVVSPGER